MFIFLVIEVVVNPKMNILSSFNRHIVPNLYDFLASAKHSLEECLKSFCLNNESEWGQFN